MAKAIQQNPAKPETTGDQIEQKILAFAKQVGVLIGTVQAKTEGWLDREALGKELTHIRDGAAELLTHVSPQPKSKQKVTAKALAPRPSRGPVDAPGKRHRKPLPDRPLGKHLGEPRGRQMGQKTVKNARRSGGR